MLEKRSNMKDKEKLDKQILENVLAFSKDDVTIAIFHSFNDEINTLPIIEALLNRGKVVVCPKIEKGVMNFYPIKNLNDFELGYFDIMEPKSKTIISPSKIDLMLVPLLAYNDKMYRIGYGGGFYDRYLSKYHAKKIGLAYRFQHIHESFEKAHDIALDGIINEKGRELL